MSSGVLFADSSLALAILFAGQLAYLAQAPESLDPGDFDSTLRFALRRLLDGPSGTPTPVARRNHKLRSWLQLSTVADAAATVPLQPHCWNSFMSALGTVQGVGMLKLTSRGIYILDCQNLRFEIRIRCCHVGDLPAGLC